MTNSNQGKTPKPAVERRDGADRRDTPERREGPERRKNTAPVSVERRKGAERRTPGPEGERRKVQRRINEYVLPAEVLEFINAVNEFKSVQQKPFPTWSDIYQIFQSLGYRKP